VGDASDRSSDRLHRLEDIEVREVSLVDRAANKRNFLIVKRSGEMAEETKDLTEKVAKAEAERDELQKSLDAVTAEVATLKEAAGEDKTAELQKSLEEAQVEIAKLKESAPVGSENADQDDDAAELQKSLDDSKEKIAKLQAQADEAVELAKRVATLEKDKSDTEHAAIMKSLKDDGKLPKSLEEWAGKQTADDLREFAKVAPTVLKTGRTLPADAADGSMVLTDVEAQVSKMIGIPTEKFIETRKAEIKKQAERAAQLTQ
jgi:chromosome segregation ATPase